MQALSKDFCINKYGWGDGCFGWNYIDTEELSIKQELIPAAKREELHYHVFANQFFFVLSGTATFEIDDLKITIVSYQGIEIKAGRKHRISNQTDVDLEFILYSQPSTKNDRINC